MFKTGDAMMFNFVSSDFFPQSNISDMSGNGCAKFGKSSGKSTGSSDFSETLGMLFNSSGNSNIKGVNNNAMDTGNDTGSQSDFDKLLDSLAKDIQSAKGNDFINKLKLYITLSGGQYDFSEGKSGKIVLNDQSLESLKQMLVKAGFDENEINDLVSKLKLKSGDGEVCLSDLLKGASKLKCKGEKSEKDDKNMLAISALPFVDSIMKSLGIPDDVSSKIISDSKEEGKGIDLDILVNGLKQVSKGSFFSGTSFSVGSDDKSIDKMLKQIGLLKTDPNSSKEAGNNKFTLEDFISSLEQMMAKGKNDGMGNKALAMTQKGEKSSKESKTTDSLLDSFMAGLKKDGDFKGSLINGNVAKQKKSNHIKANSFLQDANDPFPLKSGQQFNSTQVKSGVESIDSELSKLLDKAAGIVNNGKISNDSLSAGKTNHDILFDKANKKLFTKVSGAEGASGGTLSESRLGNRTFGSVRFGSLNKSLPPYVTNQVARGLVRAVYRGNNELKLQLKPPELGRLVVKIDNLGDSLKVSIVTENHVAKDILASHESSLKAALAGSGISIETFDVSMGSSFSQSMADAGNNSGAGTGSGSGNKSRSESIDEISDDIINRSITTDTFLNNGALHFVA